MVSGKTGGETFMGFTLTFGLHGCIFTGIIYPEASEIPMIPFAIRSPEHYIFPLSS